jgi:hypothetical protein
MNQLFKTVSGVAEHGGKTFCFRRLSIDEYIAGLVSRVQKNYTTTGSVLNYKTFVFL